MIGQAGKLRHRIRLQRKGQATAQNAYGQTAAVEWETFATRWADVRAAHGDKNVEDGQPTAVTMYRVHLRYLADVTIRHRIVLADGRCLNIKSVLDREGRNRSMELVCEEAKGAIAPAAYTNNL